MKDLLSIVSKFKVQGTVGEIKPLGAGLINDTYKVNTTEQTLPIMCCNASTMQFSRMWKCFRITLLP